MSAWTLRLLARLIWWLVVFFKLPMRLESSTILRADQVYMTRHYLFGHDGRGSAPGWRGRVPFNVFLHCLHLSDGAEYHSHPYEWAWSLILHSGYFECRWAYGAEFGSWYGPGDVNRIDHDTYHRLDVRPGRGPTWTLFVASRPKYVWWFYDAVTRKFRRASGKRAPGEAA